MLMRMNAPHKALYLRKKRTALAFLALAFTFLVAATPAERAAGSVIRVVLDAGHGGADPGNLGTGRYKTTEKNVTLAVTLKVGELLKEAHPDLEIIYTRDKDSFPTLKDRVKIANDAKADVFISIHCDAFTKASAFGSGTFVMGMHKNEESLRTAMQENASIYLEDNYEEDYQGFDPKDPDTYIALFLRQNVYLDHSITLSKHIQDKFREEVGRKDRGVKQAGYYVISYTTMPSVLVELGFLTNATEEDYLVSTKGQNEMAVAIASAFSNYKNAIEGVHIEETPPPPTPVEVPKPEPKPEVLVEQVEGDIVYKVQFLTSSTPLPLDDPRFKGIDQVEEFKNRGLYKYLAGQTATFAKAKTNQSAIRALGFTDAFVVAFRGKKQIRLADAIRKTD